MLQQELSVDRVMEKRKANRSRNCRPVPSCSRSHTQTAESSGFLQRVSPGAALLCRAIHQVNFNGLIKMPVHKAFLKSVFLTTSSALSLSG